MLVFAELWIFWRACHLDSNVKTLKTTVQCLIICYNISSVPFNRRQKVGTNPIQTRICLPENRSLANISLQSKVRLSSCSCYLHRKSLILDVLSSCCHRGCQATEPVRGPTSCELSEVHFLIGRCQSELSQYRHAHSSYTAAIQLNTKHAKVCKCMYKWTWGYFVVYLVVLSS